MACKQYVCTTTSIALCNAMQKHMQLQWSGPCLWSSSSSSCKLTTSYSITKSLAMATSTATTIGTVIRPDYTDARCVALGWNAKAAIASTSQSLCRCVACSKRIRTAASSMVMWATWKPTRSSATTTSNENVFGSYEYMEPHLHWQRAHQHKHGRLETIAANMHSCENNDTPVKSAKRNHALLKSQFRQERISTFE